MEQIKNNKAIIVIFSLLLYFGIAASGCKDDTVSNNSQTENLDFSSGSVSDTVDNAGILHIDLVKILIKDIKFNVAGGGQDSSNFKTGPYVVYLNPVSGITVFCTGLIPEGTYDKVKFEIHKLNDNEDPPDPEFADGGRYSVIVKGSYSGVPFIYRSTKSAHQMLSFPNSLAVSLTAKSNITLQVRPYLWFIDNGIFMDPADESNRNDIDNNIKDNINHNFKIFVDNDRDGLPDN